MNDVTFVIPHRAEGKWLPWTLANIEQSCPDAETIVIADSPGIGVSYRRHEGIVKADAEVVIVADAHMDFDPGLDRLTLEHLRNHPQDVVCYACPGIEPSDRRRNDAERYGADMERLSEQRKPFLSKWRGTPEGEVGNVLGGAYAFNREWYMTALGGIWRHHRAWGKSEQMISIMNYLVGGRNVCLHEIAAGHYFRNHHEKIRQFPLITRQIQRNTWLIIVGMMDTISRLELIADMKISDHERESWLNDLSMIRDTNQIKEHLSRFQTRDFVEFSARFLK